MAVGANSRQPARDSQRFSISNTICIGTVGLCSPSPPTASLSIRKALGPENPMSAEPTTTGDILVTFAVKEEMKFFPGGPGIRRYITGMGRDNAENAIAAALEEIHPRLVLTCGFAGGLNPILK